MSLAPSVVRALREQEQTWPVIRELAREDPAVFCAVVLKDETTGQPIRLSASHVEWQRLITKNKRQIIWAPPESGKTQGIAIGRVLFELGRNPTMRVLILCATHNLAVRIVRTLGRYIERSPELRDIFPNLRPATPWGETELTVKRPHIGVRDPSVLAAGVHSNILGLRANMGILDDVLTWQSTRTHSERQKLCDWYNSTVPGRMSATARMVAIGNSWHPDDLLHRWERTGAWHARRYPVVDERTGVLLWPERWPRERIEERRAELDKLSPHEFSKQMLCKVRDDSSAHFKREWIEACLDRGYGVPFARSVSAADLPAGATVWTGVDLAVEQKESADLTALVTVMRYPTGELILLNVESGRWSAPDIIGRIVEVHRRYGGVVVVESNSAQSYLIQMTRKDYPRLPVRAWNTTAKSKHFGMEALEADFAGARFIIPNREGAPDPEVEALISDALYYSPDQHAGDRLMALMIAAASARSFGRDDLGGEVSVRTFARPARRGGDGAASGAVDTGLDPRVFDDEEA